MHCEELGLTTISPLGSIILQEQLKRGVFTENYYFSTSPYRVAGPHFLIKPAGLFAVTLHKGSFDSLIARLPQILQQMETLGVSISGNAYIYDLLSYLATEKEENDVQKIMIGVKRVP